MRKPISIAPYYEHLPPCVLLDRDKESPMIVSGSKLTQ